jgi:hypothetical protein
MGKLTAADRAGNEIGNFDSADNVQNPHWAKITTGPTIWRPTEFRRHTPTFLSAQEGCLGRLATMDESWLVRFNDRVLAR